MGLARGEYKRVGRLVDIDSLVSDGYSSNNRGVGVGRNG
jgi:hypothetical protein